MVRKDVGQGGVSSGAGYSTSANTDAEAPGQKNDDAKTAASGKTQDATSGRGSEEVPSFEVWLRVNAAWLLRQAYFITWNQDTAEDIAQDAAIKFYRAWNVTEQRQKILESKAYVWRIILNCHLDYKKNPSRTSDREKSFDDESHHIEVDTKSGLEIREALLRLPETERDMLFLIYYGGLTIGEAGQELGIPPTQAYRFHKRALRDLAALLEEG
jgi:RNA polymerase sigma factor (sigma-70 family)